MCTGYSVGIVSLIQAPADILRSLFLQHGILSPMCCYHGSWKDYSHKSERIWMW